VIGLVKVKLLEIGRGRRWCRRRKHCPTKP
jgi:hypothetical protein